VRVVIGLIQAGLSIDEVADLLEAKHSDVRAFWRRLTLRTEHRVVAQALHGLTSEDVADLPGSKTVTCRRCNSEIRTVPCVLCSARAYDGEPEAEISLEELEAFGSLIYQANPPAKPTTLLPGTADKLYLMMDRVANGESCFHPDDATWYSQPSNTDSLSVMAEPDLAEDDEEDSYDP
jgi:hypothetical protein